MRQPSHATARSRSHCAPLRCSRRPLARCGRRRRAASRRCRPPTTARGASARPRRPGHAGCLALQLVPADAPPRARRTAPAGRRRAAAPTRRPRPRRAASACARRTCTAPTRSPPAPRRAQTIAIVDAYNDPTAEADLQAYDEEFGLPACTTGNGCFKQVNQNGERSPLPFPKTLGRTRSRARKGSEAEAEERRRSDRLGSRDLARHRDRPRDLPELPHPARRGELEPATPTSKPPSTPPRASARPRSPTPGAAPRKATTPAQEAASPFNHPGIVITASAGDNGYLDWDAEAPRTRLRRVPGLLPPRGGRRRHAPEPRRRQRAGRARRCGTARRRAAAAAASTSPPQPGSRRCRTGRRSGCGDKRAVADVSADADPYTGVAVARHEPGLRNALRRRQSQTRACTGARSAARASPRRSSPRCSRSRAAAAASPTRPPRCTRTRSRRPPALHDVTSGSNGECAHRSTEETGLSGCTPAEEAAASCASAPDLPGRRAATTARRGVGTPARHRAPSSRPRANEGGRPEAKAAARRRAAAPAAARRPVAAAARRRRRRAEGLGGSELRRPAPGPGPRVRRPGAGGAASQLADARADASRRSWRSTASRPRHRAGGASRSRSAPPARVRVTLAQARAQRTATRAGSRCPASPTITAAAGRNSAPPRRPPRRSAAAATVLTLTPATRRPPRSVRFQIG